MGEDEGMKGEQHAQICQIMFSLQGKFDNMKRDGWAKEKLDTRRVLNITKTAVALQM